MKLSSLNKGLVGSWNLDKESLQSATIFADNTPHENKGTSANAPVFTTDRMGQADRAMSFNGSKDKIMADGVIADIDLTTTGNVTMCGWFKRTASTGLSFQGFGVDGSWLNYFLFYFGNTFLECAIKGGAGVVVEARDATDYSGEWIHACGVKTGTALELFVNGTSKDTDTGLDNNIVVTSFDVGWMYSNAYGFNGNIADVRIYNRALSQQEITQLANVYRPKLSLGSLNRGLVLDLPMNLRWSR